LFGTTLLTVGRGKIVTFVDTVAVPSEAERVTAVGVATLPAMPETLYCVTPAGSVTVAGTERAEEFEVPSEIVMPPAGTGPVRNTVIPTLPA
jgi:hypothetical protein